MPEQVEENSWLSRWKQLETPIALILSVTALVFSILSYKNSTAVRYNVIVGMPKTLTASLVDPDTSTSAQIVYGDLDDKDLGLSRVALVAEIRITNLGTRPFSIGQLSAYVKLKVHMTPTYR